MKTALANKNVLGFTLIELLIVVCILAVLVALLLPAHTDRRRPYGIACMNNQRQIAIGMIMWNEDHEKQYPWERSSTNSGTKEFAEAGYAAPNFEVLLDYIREPRAFVCPTDKSKTIATNEAAIINQNVSYFADIDAGSNATFNILTGDRHLKMNGAVAKPGLMIYDSHAKMAWTHELHRESKIPVGILSFRDGHCERVMDTNLNSLFQRHGLQTNRFDIP